MTIASCYVSPEGVVFGADSTTTYTLGGRLRHYNQAQKLFEVGTQGCLGIVTWGLGSIEAISYRKLIANLADDLVANPPVSVKDAADRWAALIWQQYVAVYAAVIAEGNRVSSLATYDPAAPIGSPTHRTKDEETFLGNLKATLAVGFCIGGYVLPAREPQAFTVSLEPLSAGPSVTLLGYGYTFWGVPIMTDRLRLGIDSGLRQEILDSGKWTGTPADLDALTARYELVHPATVPMREAIDFVHSGIYSTIKAMKFSNLPQVCGGPIEMAVITVDRCFRWVRHKGWDTAIDEPGGHNHG